MLPNELKEILPSWIIIAFALYGLVIIILQSFKFLFQFIPEFKINTYNKLALWTKNKKLIRKAEKANISQILNDTIIDIGKELPTNWVKKTAIKWVSKIQEDEIDEGELILRIIPTEFQNQNLLFAIYSFFNKILFPNVQKIIPDCIRKSTALQISYRLIDEKHPNMVELFEDKIIEDSIKKDQKIISYLEKYSKIDKRGLFTGIFIREMYEIANKARMKTLRFKLEDEADNLLDHINKFVEHYESKSDNDIENDDFWYRKGPETSYAILLVAFPLKAKYQGLRPYVNRAKKHRDNGIKRLYVIGARKQQPFVEDVIASVENISNFNLVEIFNPNKDYQGKTGGVCALFKIN